MQGLYTARKIKFIQALQAMLGLTISLMLIACFSTVVLDYWQISPKSLTSDSGGGVIILS